MAQKKSASKGKKEKAKKEGYKIFKIFKIEGDKITSKNKTCPKCGKSIFMANHKDRWTCGKCQYMEKK